MAKGSLEWMNRTIKETTMGRYHFATHKTLKEYFPFGDYASCKRKTLLLLQSAVRLGSARVQVDGIFDGVRSMPHLQLPHFIQVSDRYIPLP